VAGLLVVELLEELGGEGGVFSDGGGRGGAMVSRCGGLVGWVGAFGHPLSMVDAEGVSAKGGVGILVLEGLALPLVSLLLWFLLVGSWQIKSVITQVPRRQG